MATAKSATMVPVEYKDFINGKWVASVTGKTFENRNPADPRELVSTLQKSDKRDDDKAVAVAAKAFKSWRPVLTPKCAEILFGHRL
jgi:aldehyde dehydrogenase (NAD+)